MRQLTVRDHMTLTFAAQRFTREGPRASTIRDTFTESSVRFDARLNRLLDDPAAEATYPQLVRRLRRIRDGRRGVRRGELAAGLGYSNGYS